MALRTISRLLLASTLATPAFGSILTLEPAGGLADGSSLSFDGSGSWESSDADAVLVDSTGSLDGSGTAGDAVETSTLDLLLGESASLSEQTLEGGAPPLEASTSDSKGLPPIGETESTSASTDTQIYFSGESFTGSSGGFSTDLTSSPVPGGSGVIPIVLALRGRRRRS